MNEAERTRVFQVFHEMAVEQERNKGRVTPHMQELEQELVLTLKTKEAIDKMRAEFNLRLAAMKKRQMRDYMMRVSLLAMGYLNGNLPIPKSLVLLARRFAKITDPVESMKELSKKDMKSKSVAKQSKGEPVGRAAKSAPPKPKVDLVAKMLEEEKAKWKVSSVGPMTLGKLQEHVQKQLFYIRNPYEDKSAESVEAQMRSMFAAAVVSHSKDMKAFWNQCQELRNGISAEVKKKGAAKEVETLKRLKATNLESYFAELRERKDDRIQMILNQTQDCLEQIIGKLEMSNQSVFCQIGQRKSADALASSLQQTIFGHARTVKEPAGLGEGGDLRLKIYQLEGLRWLVSLNAFNLNGILADEMGLGKTVQTIAFLLYLKEHGLVKRQHLIVAPTAVLPNWLQEFRIWAPKLSVAEWSARIPLSERAAHFKNKVQPAEIVVTTYDFIRDHQRRKTIEKWGKLPHLSKMKWHVIVVDEAHHINNNASQVAKALRKFVCLRKFLLTGTPLQNSLQDLWALLNYLMPEVFSSDSDFDQWFESPFGEEKTEMTHEEKTLIILRLHKVLAPFMLRRVKSDVASDLPDVIERTLACDFSELQELMIQFVQRGEVPKLPALDEAAVVRRALSGGAGMSAVGGNNMLRKVCNHPFLVYSEQGSSTSFPWEVFNPDFTPEMFVRASGKFVVLDVVLQKLKLCGHRVLIYSPWTQTLEMIAELLRLREHRFLELTGATTGENRDRLIGQFNADSSVFAFLVSTHAGGEGVNLQVADTVIIFESDWNPQRDKQAKARVHRLGQERKVLCLNLVSVGEEFESQDQKKFGRADNKRKMEEKVIGAGNFVESTTDRDRIETVSSMYRDEEQDGLLFRKTDQLDRLIARDEEELEKLAKNPIPMPELLTMAELPLWIKTPNVKKPKDRGVTDGVRKRKVVSYKEQKINSDEEDSDDGPTPMQIEENEQEQQEEQEVEEEEEEEEEEVGEQPEPLRVQESTTVKIKLKRPRPVADLRENQEFMETFTSLSYSAPDLIGADEFPELGDLDDLNWL